MISVKDECFIALLFCLIFGIIANKRKCFNNEENINSRR